MFTINGFIQLSFLIVYSLKMVMESVTEILVYFHNISIEVTDCT